MSYESGHSGRLGVPKTEKVNCFTAVADDANIVGHAFDDLLIDPLRFEDAFAIHLVLDAAVELYFLGEVWAHDLPRAAFFHPDVGMLDLVTVYKLLAEEAELVVDTVTDGRQV